MGPDHAELLQLRDAVLVHVPAGVEPARVCGPLPQREGGETLAESIGTEGEFEGIDKTELGSLLRKAGCGNAVSIGAIDGLKNAKGYKGSALEAALTDTSTPS
ncbi:hypothetical protein [Streptomyces sp. NBC_00057]|uniref:hypothetical protein n=1 Tax=Streptomyces sp. NBC_00057 TaxID=2975634 RepID=UPI00324B8D33